MRHAKRTLIRHLYFVWQMPVDAIAAELRLRPRTVRRALVLRGGAQRHRPFTSPQTPNIPTQEDPSC
jgi:hypothetical protein